MALTVVCFRMSIYFSSWPGQLLVAAHGVLTEPCAVFHCGTSTLVAACRLGPSVPFGIPVPGPEIKPRSPTAILVRVEWYVNCGLDLHFTSDCVDHNKLWKILKEMGIPDHLTCLLRNLYAGQEATVRTGHETTVWFQIGKGVRQGCILSPCLFNFYAEYIMRNTGLEEAQVGIKIAGRNINHLRYADDTTLMAESEEELKSLWWKWKWRVKKLA